MSAQRDFGQGGAYPAGEQSASPAGTQNSIGPQQDGLLPLHEAERVRFRLAGALGRSEDGIECLRGLTREESLEYVALQRRGLDNDDDAFLRYILLGDRLAVAIAQSRG